MRRGGGKEKGSVFERQIAKEFGELYYKDTSALLRNFNSGGLATMRTGAGLPAGDIIQVKYMDKPFPFSVECKHHKEFKIQNLIFERKNSKEMKAWKQCLRDAETVNKIPMLVFKENYGDVVLCFRAPKVRALEYMWHHCYTKNLLMVTLNHFLQDEHLRLVVEDPTLGFVG